MPVRTCACGTWSFTASAWSCAGVCAAFRWRSTCRWLHFLGVALRVIPNGEAATVCLTLEHPDPDLSIALYQSGESDEVVAEWQSWAKILQRPLLVTDDGGALHELFPRLGQLRLGQVVSRAPPPHGDESASAVDRLAPAQRICKQHRASRRARNYAAGLAALSRNHDLIERIRELADAVNDDLDHVGSLPHHADAERGAAGDNVARHQRHVA